MLMYFLTKISNTSRFFKSFLNYNLKLILFDSKYKIRLNLGKKFKKGREFRQN